MWKGGVGSCLRTFLVRVDQRGSQLMGVVREGYEWRSK
jgi:hypothetical protein